MELVKYENLAKRYKGTMAVDHLNLSIPSGKIIGLLGPNGSGKTTLLKMTAGILYPSDGVITVDGLPVGENTKKIVSYLPERIYFDSGMKVSETFDYFADFYSDFDRVKATEMLQTLNVAQTARIRTLSKGMREKLQLTLVMCRAAKLYLLDEPIAGVDPAARDFILNTIIKNYSENATVVISTHLIADIEAVLDDCIFLCRGKITLQGGADEIRAEYGKSIDALFREVFRV